MPKGTASQDRDAQESNWTNAKDHLACDQCRIKKIRCDKGRPQCSNCTRLSLYCEWSGQGKKPSQTVLLNQSITTIIDRLEQIESGISDIQRHLQQKQVSPSSSSPIVAQDANEGTQKVVLAHHVVRGPHGYERHFGPTSLMSLLHNFDSLALGLPEQDEGLSGTTSPGPITMARAKIQRLATSRPAARDMGDTSAIKGPSILILVAMLEFYFDLCNPHLPIFTRNGFQRLLDGAGKADATHTRAFAICANNLVLLTLTTKALGGRAILSRGSKGTTIDSELIQSFVENADRTIGQADQLLQPRLINVQALLSLCVVAQTCLSEEVFSLALALAGQVAKSMGLYQSQEWGTQLSPEDVEERQNVLYCLYCLDKAVCWNQGWPPSITYVASGWVGSTAVDPRVGTYMRAKFALCQIEEDLYSSLYSSGLAALRSDDPIAGHNIQTFQVKFSNWRKVYALDKEQESEQDSSYIESSRLDLEICYHLARMQLLSPFAETMDICFTLLEDARKCLKLLQDLWDIAPDERCYASFIRLVSALPTTVICRLTAQSMGPHRSGDDLALLSFLSRSLHAVLSLFATKDSYMAKLSIFVDIMLSFAQNRQSNQHPNASRYTLMEASHQKPPASRHAVHQNQPGSGSGAQGLFATDPNMDLHYEEAQEIDTTGNIDSLMAFWSSEMTSSSMMPVDPMLDKGMDREQRWE